MFIQWFPALLHIITMCHPVNFRLIKQYYMSMHIISYPWYRAFRPIPDSPWRATAISFTFLGQYQCCYILEPLGDLDCSFNIYSFILIGTHHRAWCVHKIIFRSVRFAEFTRQECIFCQGFILPIPIICIFRVKLLDGLPQTTFSSSFLKHEAHHQ